MYPSQLPPLLKLSPPLLVAQVVTASLVDSAIPGLKHLEVEVLGLVVAAHQAHQALQAALILDLVEIALDLEIFQGETIVVSGEVEIAALGEMEIVALGEVEIVGSE